jgi:hypothetical protein
MDNLTAFCSENVDSIRGVKVKVHPITGTGAEQRYGSTLSLTLALPSE